MENVNGLIEKLYFNEDGVYEITRGFTYKGFTHFPKQYEDILYHQASLRRLGYAVIEERFSNWGARGSTIKVYTPSFVTEQYLAKQKLVCGVFAMLVLITSLGFLFIGR